MARVVAFVDGFNLYHSLKDSPDLRGYRWLDLDRLIRNLLKKTDTLQDVLYFTALAYWVQAKQQRHLRYIRALESVGVTPVFGEFKPRDKKCAVCGRPYRTFEEKQTDVNIAIQLLRLAIRDRYDTALIVSADSDLIPAIRAVHQEFPGKRLGVVLPVGRASESLKNHADFHIKLKRIHLQSSKFPDQISLPDGSVLTKPDFW